MTTIYGVILEIIHGYDRHLLEHLRVCKENELRQIHYMRYAYSMYCTEI